jgi:hypothetical protein
LEKKGERREGRKRREGGGREGREERRRDGMEEEGRRREEGREKEGRRERGKGGREGEDHAAQIERLQMYIGIELQAIFVTVNLCKPGMAFLTGSRRTSPSCDIKRQPQAHR